MKIQIVGLATFDQMAGGSARYLTGLSEGLRRLGHRVEVHTSAGYVATRGYTETGIVGQLRRTAKRFLVYMPKTFVAVLGARPDIVNSHFALDGLPAVLAAALIRRPVIVNFQGPWAQEAVATGRRGGWPLSTHARRLVERLVYCHARRCIALSRAFADILVEEYGVAPARVRVIPGGLDTARFAGLPKAPEARRRLGLEERYTLITVRRLVPRMGLELAIDALADITTTRDAQLIVAGVGPERDHLEQHARARGVSNRLRFLGRVDDAELPLVYAAGDVCVVPSRELEGFGYTALEALAAGTPVIAAGTGGLVELVGALEPRWVVSRDGRSIAEAINRLASERHEYPDPDACRRYARTMDWAVVLPRVVAVFHEAGARAGRLRIGQAFGVADREILDAAIGVIDEPGEPARARSVSADPTDDGRQVDR